MSVQVNHPDYYNLPGKKECIEQMLEDYGERVTAVFCMTNAYKYLYRAGHKDAESEQTDIEKALWYFNFVNNRLFTYISGSKQIKLYRDVKEMLNKYDKRGKY